MKSIWKKTTISIFFILLIATGTFIYLNGWQVTGEVVGLDKIFRSNADICFDDALICAFNCTSGLIPEIIGNECSTNCISTMDGCYDINFSELSPKRNESANCLFKCILIDKNWNSTCINDCIA